MRRRDACQAAAFERWLDELQRAFEGRILSVDVRVAEEWGRLDADSPKKMVDSLIAATAIVHDLTVVTGNTRDFEACGVALLDPRR